MRTTVTLDDDLLAQAGAAMGTTERSVLLHEGLKLIVQREAARRLAALGASAPGLDLPARRRPAPKAARAARPRRTR
ncbi:MAG: type II toxin-antitoxin system VapB family antitoxin [Rubrivivax sp.]|nr:type II toxin-antitoxin system VapB family antitoxin [Rubrivivax sp.]